MTHDLSIPIAFLAGIVSFLSPCVLPLVPGYISMLSGASIEELKKEASGELLRRVLRNSLAFVVGFTLVFVILGATATWVGHFLRAHQATFNIIAGIIVIIFGFFLTGLPRTLLFYCETRLDKLKPRRGLYMALLVGFWLTIGWWGLLYREARLDTGAPRRGLGGAFLVGFAFAFGWTPCIGPILGAIMLLAEQRQTVSQGMFLLAVYSAGLAIPFLLTSVLLTSFLKFYKGFRKHMQAVEVTSGVLLIALGALMAFNKLTILARYFSFLNRFSL
jgi:cytochrome c-type biogenesis protein